jgi:protein-tyrosine phosphatase
MAARKRAAAGAAAATPPVLSINFVCTGNICRSPSAEVIARDKLAAAGLGELVLVRSCGTAGYHVGEGADSRSVAHAAKRGYDLSSHRASTLFREHFADYDLLLGLDGGHVRAMLADAPPAHRRKVVLLGDYARSARFRGTDCPDPYYDGAAAFELVLDHLEDAVGGLVATIAAALEEGGDGGGGGGDPAEAVLTPLAAADAAFSTAAGRGGAGAMPHAPKR